MVRKLPQKQKADLLKEWVSVTPEEYTPKRNVPFLEAYLEENEYELPLISMVEDVVKSESGKGYSIITEDFRVFTFMKTPLTKFMIEALNKFVEKGKGYPLAVVVTSTPKDKKPVWDLRSNKNIDLIDYFISDDGKKYSVFPITDTEAYVSGINPLL